MTGHPTHLPRSERMYDLLLRMYPKGYRQAFGEEMQYVFSESLKDAGTENHRMELFRFWTRTLLDTGKTLVIQHADNLTGGASMKSILIRNKNIFLIALATALILLMFYFIQSSDPIGWSAGDFIFAGTFLFGTGLAFELITRKRGTFAYRAAVALALGTALFLFWSNLAVGLIGSDDNPANWMYVGVLVILFIGSLLAQFRPRGMVRVLFATAIAQASTIVIALVAVKNLDLLQLFALNAFFTAMWVGSALLFRQAASQKPPA